MTAKLQATSVGLLAVFATSVWAAQAGSEAGADVRVPTPSPGTRPRIIATTDGEVRQSLATHGSRSRQGLIAAAVP